MIKKFKNGNIHLKMEENQKDKTITDLQNGEAFYNEEFFWNDLYIQMIDGYAYIVDFNTQRVYDIPHNHYGMFFEDIAKCKKIILYPYSKRESRKMIDNID